MMPALLESPRRRIVCSLGAALPLAAALFFFGPLQIYIPNSRMFSYMLAKVVARFGPVALVAWLGLAAILALLPHRLGLRRRLAALALAAAALLWLQANLINWQYGPLDGRTIHWRTLAFRGWIDGTVWLIGLAAAWRWSDLLRLRTVSVAGFLLLLQALTLVPLLLQHAEVWQAKNYMLFDESVRFDFSDRGNALILISDGFQSDLFQELLDEDPAWRKVFSGFTYFRNTLAGFPLTTPSVPYLLTGMACDNSVPFADYLRSAYRSPGSLLQTLQASGWRTDILMEAGGCFDQDRPLASNLYRGQVPLTNRQAGFLFDLTLFRQLPHFLKRLVYADQRWRFLRYLQDRRLADGRRLAAACNPVTGRPFPERDLDELYDVRFLADLETGGSCADGPPVFKLYHLKGMHPPLRMNERLEFQPLPNNRRDWKRQGRGSLAIIKAFLERLRRLGAYENTAIVVMGDHGASAGQFGLRLPQGWSQTPGTVPEAVRVSGLPLMLVRRPGESGPLQVNDAPVTVGDVPATLRESLGLPAAGVSMFALDPQASRPRRFSHFIWNPGDSGKPFLPALTTYQVDGHAWLAGSWRALPAVR